MPGILGKKIGMTRIINEEGQTVPVTVLCCEPNVVTQIKTAEKDGYDAVVLACSPRKAPTKNKKHLFTREFRIMADENYELGGQVDLSALAEVEKVSVTSISKGKGFQGVIKRHNFSRGPESHGSRHHREPGSIGACAMPGRVAKGKKLPGRMGNKQVTIHNVSVVLIDKSKNLIALKGAIAGPINGLVKLTV